MMRIPQLLQRFTATALCVLLAGPLSWAQNQRLEPIRPSTPVLRTYEAVTIPPVKLTNSPRLRDLIRAGKLYLTAQDAIALALENNLDLESYRYNPLTAVWNEKRGDRRTLCAAGSGGPRPMCVVDRRDRESAGRR